MSSYKKIYLRPLSFVDTTVGKKLFKEKKSLKVGGEDVFFTQIEVIFLSKKITSKLFYVSDFLKFLKSNSNRRIEYLLKKLTKKRNIPDLLKSKLKNKQFLIFGILNITPDSFSDGNDFFKFEDSVIQAKKLCDEGADFIDIGGESTRPGAKLVKKNDEILRILPIIQELSINKTAISLDTRNSETMKLGILSGVSIINDVSALNNDKNSINIIKENNVPIILMHMPGNPKTMMKKNIYKNVVLDVFDFLDERIKFCESMGIKRENIIIDPGIGFGKDSEQNISLLNNISIFHALGCLIMLGVSRKRFISSLVDSQKPKDRLPGSISAALYGLNHGVQIFRVHDVKETKQALGMWSKLGV